MKKRLILSIIVTLLLASYIFFTKAHPGIIECPVIALTGYTCCFCGCTRTTWAILDLKFIEAFYYNQFYFLLLPYLILKYIHILYDFVKNNRFRITPDMIFIGISAIIFMVLRNLEPFYFLLPTGDLY